MEPQEDAGQVAATDPTGTTDATPGSDDGQSISTDQTTSDGPDAGAKDESFFDPKSIEHSPELMQAYKQMQGNFSKKMQGIRDSRQKIDAYDAAMRDPQGTARQLAAQLGMTVVDGQPQPVGGEEFKPQSWEDVVTHVTEQVREEMSQQYAPLVGEVKNLKQQNIEQYLDGNYSDWRTYESEMIGTLQKHPSMANDPDTLYRLSVPTEVMEARATERALKKLKGGVDAGAVGGTKKATQQTSTQPTGPLSFDEAVKFAKGQLASRGITGSVGS
jgi:hypothetical protein